MANDKKVIGIVVKASHPSAAKHTEALISWIEKRRVEYFIDSEIVDELPKGRVDNTRILQREHFTTKCSPIVVLGGDGTLISVCRHAAKTPPVILGVNLGTLGFLTEITIEELFPTLEAVLKDRATLERRPLLLAKVKKSGKEVVHYTAMNDIVVTKEALSRIFEIDLFVDGKFATTVRGDGVIVSTPTGSTAYSMAAGGSIVHPAVDALLVTPVCAHTLTSRPLVLPGSTEVSLRVREHSRVDENDDIYLTVDGQEGMRFSADQEIVATMSDFGVLFAKSGARTYFEVLGTKLKWASSTTS